MSEPVWLFGADPTPSIVADGVTVWLADLDDPDTRARAERLALLPGEVEAVAGRRDAGERLLRRRLARLLLGAACDERSDMVELGRTALGAPVVVSPGGWHVSVAARWPLCAIGIARRPIGVDIEAVGEPLPDDILTEAERHAPLTSLVSRGTDNRHAAAARWAAKEAHAKWTGRPRALDPAAIDTARLPLVTSRFGTTRCWLRDVDDHVAAVCTA